MNNKILMLGLVCLLSACASIHSGKYATVESSNASSQDKIKQKSNNKVNFKTKSGLIVSGEEIADMSSKYFAQIDFTFENKTSNWIYIKNVKMSFGSSDIDSQLGYPVGSDLIAWADATSRNLQIKNYNTNLALSSIAALGAVAATASSDANVKKIGLATSVASGAALTVKTINNELNSVQLSKLVPESHLLADNFVVPPGLHSKKWITIYSSKPYVLPYLNNMSLELTLSDGTTEKFNLVFRDGSKSKWQKDHYELANNSKWYSFYEAKRVQMKNIAGDFDKEEIKRQYIELISNED